MENVSKTVVRELVLYIINDRELYRRCVQPVLQNLAKKIVKGTYDYKLAKKSWYNVTFTGMKQYTADYCSYGDKWYILANMEERKLIVDELQNYYEEELNDLVDELNDK